MKKLICCVATLGLFTTLGIGAFTLYSNAKVEDKTIDYFDQAYAASNDSMSSASTETTDYFADESVEQQVPVENTETVIDNSQYIEGYDAIDSMRKSQVAALEQNATADESTSATAEESTSTTTNTNDTSKYDVINNVITPETVWSNNSNTVSKAETFNYVAIGNSVTCNELSDFWWNTGGMAASSPSKDYVHLITEWIKSQSGKSVSMQTADAKRWETASDRNSQLSYYDAYVGSSTNLITIQIGENITENKQSLAQDFLVLFQHLKEKAPNAQILVIGELLWPSADIEAAKQSACNQLGITFIDASEFLNGYESTYRASMNSLVLGDDGGQHAINYDIVAAHPNDAGMACIANLFERHIKL